MNTLGIIQIVVYLIVLLALVKPLGLYMARVYDGKVGLERILGPLERLIYRVCGVRANEEMDWKIYAIAMLLFNLLGIVVVFLLQLLQGLLPLNPQHFPLVHWDLALNTAISFATNTNWQSYSGESTLSYLVQMLGLTVQNFVSAAKGMAVLVALVRGFTRRNAATIGNFWVDMTRSTLYILLPLCVILAVVLVSQGVVQTLTSYPEAQVLQPFKDANSTLVSSQTIAVGPAASQIAIKQLGTNGGGFFNTNSAHPLENPTPLSNFLEVLAILLIAAALCYTFGQMVGDRRQGWAILVAMLLIFIPMLILCCWSEARGNPLLVKLGVDQSASNLNLGGNMEGKEVRFGVANSALWATATASASNGSVNSMHDSYTPLGGLVPMWMIQLGEVVFGGVGSGLYGMLMFAIIAVFVAGLMVGRTPEYLGKKIEAFEMKMASLAILIPPAAVLLGTALAVSVEAGRSAVANSGPHGFSEILYAFTSTANNNGSVFAGLSTDRLFYNLSLAGAMFIGRYALAVVVLAAAGSLAGKKYVPQSAGTLPTHRPLFVFWLALVVLIVGALAFLPALALGPIVEHLILYGAH